MSKAQLTQPATPRPVVTYDGDDYRVPHPDGREASAYYTDDKEDAIRTGSLMWGDTFAAVPLPGHGTGRMVRQPIFRVRRVMQHPGADT